MNEQNHKTYLPNLNQKIIKIINQQLSFFFILKLQTLKTIVISKITKKTMGQDFKSLYENKCIEFQQLSQQFNELQQQSTLIMNDLQDEIKQLKRKNQMYQRQVKDLKEKKKYITSTIQRQLDQAQRQKNEFKNKFKDFEKKVIELQIINQDLENELRATKSTLQEYQSSTERTMEQLAILRIQLQESTSSNQQQIARLRQQLKQTEEEISIMHRKIKKNQNETHSQINLTVKTQTQSIAVPQNKSLPRSESGLIQNINHQQTHKKDAFRDTLRSIREYMQSIDTRTDQLKKTILNNRQFLLASNF